MMGRILTLQVEIQDKEQASWIWDNHMNQGGSQGVFVTSIRSGPMPEVEQIRSWIKVDDRKPPNDVYVLAAKYHRHKKSGFDSFFVQIAKRMNDAWIDDHDGELLSPKDGLITHWMPLPDDPEKEWS